MERQFLNIVILLSFIISGCQQIPENNSITLIQIKNNDQDTKQIYLDKEDKLLSYYSDIWDYILMKSSYSSDNLDEQTLFYMNRHLQDLDNFKEYLNDSYYFLFFVVEELEKADMPLEFAFLPYIESNYDPFSISPSGAVGMWQFMPRTGRYYELEKSWWNEDRHDPFKSTEAAIQYLKYLYERFDNDIYLTLAAYNAGPSFLDRQIKKNQRRGLDTDFWSLDLPTQTRDYVPKFIALNELILNSNNYEIELPLIPYEPVVAKIEIPGQVEVLTLSEFLNIKPELLYKLNAGYTKWASAPSDKSIFYVPIEKYDYFQTSDNPFIKTNQVNWISHLVQRGDNLWSLASKYDTEVNMYGETSEGKVYKPGIQVSAVVDAEDQTTTTDEFGPDLQQNALFSFVRQSLVDVSYVIEIGDVVEWNSGYWEISSISENQLVGGQTDYNHSVVCNSFLVRISNLNIERVRSV